VIRLSETQRKIVEHGDGSLLVIAGAGSGKTLVLTERIRYLLTNKTGHYRVLGLTFTNKAADEMRERLEDIDNIDNRAFIGTMHKFCMEVVQQRGNAIGWQTIPNVFSETDDLVQIVSDVFRSTPQLTAILETKENPKQYLQMVYQYISQQKRNLREPEWFVEQPDLSDDANLFAYVYRQYNDTLHAQNAIDFDDILFLTYNIFTQRPKIADMHRRLYKYICIDESQDLNFAQYNVLKAMCGVQFNNLMMVGDPRQAIYGFNDASSDFMCKEFVKDFSPVTIELVENYRSSQAVIDIARNMEPDFKMEGIIAISGEAEAYCFPDERTEAEWVVKNLEKLNIHGHPDIDDSIAWNRCAILARNRYVTKHIEVCLANRNIPYYIRLSSAQESESDIIKCFELGIRLIINPSDYIHLQQLTKLVGINNIKVSKEYQDGNEILTNIFEQVRDNDSLSECWNEYEQPLLESWRMLADNNPKFTKALDILEKYTKQDITDEQQKEIIMNDIIMWRDHWKKYLGSSNYSARSLAQFWNQVALGTTKTHADKNAVALLTVHNSKGLEFDVVFIVGMCEGVFPDYRAVQKSGKDLLEEQHNAFVAITRSRRLLYISYPEYREMPWGDMKFQLPSRFLGKMGITIKTSSLDRENFILKNLIK